MKNTLINLTLIVVSTLIAIIMAETGARLAGIDPNTSLYTAYEFDETVGWVPRKNFKYYRSTLYFGHFNYYDQYGFPTGRTTFDRTLDQEKPTFAIMGDSFAQGHYVPYESSIAGVLENDFPDHQIVTLGVSGHSPDQTYLYTKDILDQFAIAKAAILFFSYNDIEAVHSDSFQGYDKPYFEDPYGEPINLPLHADKQNEVKKIFIEKILHNSALYSTVRPLLRSKISYRLKTAVGSPVVYDAKQMRKSLQFYERMQKENEETDFVVYYVPLLEELQNLDIYAKNVTMFSILCMDIGLNCETFSFFENKPVEGYYIIGDGHFSELGCKYVAESIKKRQLPLEN
jgi:hypothetical protein